MFCPTTSIFSLLLASIDVKLRKREILTVVPYSASAADTVVAVSATSEGLVPSVRAVVTVANGVWRVKFTCLPSFLGWLRICAPSLCTYSYSARARKTFS